jgi:4-hydroxy-3-methylbut-2-enyl diphosphate reductase
MLGEIVHNEHVIADLKQKGLKIVNQPEQVRDKGTVIIQSHGASRQVIRHLKSRGIPFIDATCPMVKIIHQHIRDLEEAGYYPVVIGRRGHDEVEGIVGQVREALIVGEVSDVTAEKFKRLTRVGVVIQSTFIREKAMRIRDEIMKWVADIKLIDTICQPTTSRQKEIREKAGQHDCILIIGSYSSANTNHLYQLARKEKDCVYLIDSPEQIGSVALPNRGSIFIASGASTPEYLIDEIITLLEKRMISNT